MSDLSRYREGGLWCPMQVSGDVMPCLTRGNAVNITHQRATLDLDGLSAVTQDDGTGAPPVPLPNPNTPRSPTSGT